MQLHRGAAIGGLVTTLMSSVYSNLRLELPFVPAIAVRLALMIKRLPRRERRYREPVRATTPLEALRQRLHTLPDQADV